MLHVFFFFRYHSCVLMLTFDAVCLQAGSSSESILKAMSQELVPAGPLALKQEKEQITLDG